VTQLSGWIKRRRTVLIFLRFTVLGSYGVVVNMVEWDFPSGQHRRQGAPAKAYSKLILALPGYDRLSKPTYR
jgi:hypothetical protein